MLKVCLSIILLLSISFIYCIGGDTFETAVEFTSYPMIDAGDTSIMTDTFGNSSNDVFYRFTTSDYASNHSVMVYGISFNPFAYILDESLSVLYSDSGSGTSTVVTIDDVNLSPYSTYYICIESAGNITGEYRVAYFDGMNGSYYPYIPQRISTSIPLDNSTSISLAPTITWDFGSKVDTYSVSFGTNLNDMVEYVINEPAGTYGMFTPPYELIPSTTYRCLIQNGVGLTQSSVIEFTTDYGSNLHISNTAPSIGSENISIQPVLTWEFDANTEYYDLYFDTTNPPLNRVVNNATALEIGTYIPSELDYDTLYFWKVVSRNSTMTSEDTFCFHTRIGMNTVSVGEGRETEMLPIYPYAGYSYSQSIYLQDEFGYGNEISKLGYCYTEEFDLVNSNDWTIYMGHTANSSFSNLNDWVPNSQLTEVYSGPLPEINKDGWYIFDLDTPFIQNGIDNLVIAVNENQYNNDKINTSFYSSAVSSKRSLVTYNYTNQIDTNALPEARERLYLIPNTRFYYSDFADSTSLVSIPGLYYFDEIHAHTVSDTVSFLLENRGVNGVLIQSIALSDNLNFSLLNDTVLPVELETYQNIEIKAQFTPSSVENHNANIIVTYNDDRVLPVPLNGVSDEPASIDEDIVVNSHVTELQGNYPNPFNPTTQINFSIDKETNVSIDIYNIRGQKVVNLVQDRLGAGAHSVVWDGKDDNNSALSSGVYFYSLKTERNTITKKMMLLK